MGALGQPPPAYPSPRPGRQSQGEPAPRTTTSRHWPQEHGCRRVHGFGYCTAVRGLGVAALLSATGLLTACGGDDPETPIIVETCGGEVTQVHVVHPDSSGDPLAEGYGVYGEGFGIASRSGHPVPYPGQPQSKARPTTRAAKTDADSAPIGAPRPRHDGSIPPPPDDRSDLSSADEDARNLAEAKANMREAYDNFKDALEPAAEYVSDKTRKAYFEGMRALSRAFANLSDDAADAASTEDAPLDPPPPPAAPPPPSVEEP